MLSEVGICRIADVDRNRRREWAKRGLVSQKGNEKYGELDVAELAVFRLLVAELDFDRAREAWLGARGSLKDALLADMRLAVYNEGRAEAIVATTPKQLYEFTARGGRFRIVDVSAALDNALEGFRNAVKAKRGSAKRPTKASKVQQIRRKSAF